MNAKLTIIKRLIKHSIKLDFNTFYFNFRYFKLKDAIRLPVIVSKNVLFRSAKGSVILEGSVHYGMINIGGGHVGIFDKKRSKTIWEISGSVTFKGKAHIGHGSKIVALNKSELIFGDKFTITAQTAIIAEKKIVFGNNCLLSWDILVMDSDAHTITNQQEDIINAPKEIILGDRVWVGCRCTILKGTVIPSESVIGAGSVISRELYQEHGLYAGIPAKLIKENISWK